MYQQGGPEWSLVEPSEQQDSGSQESQGRTSIPWLPVPSSCRTLLQVPSYAQQPQGESLISCHPPDWTHKESWMGWLSIPWQAPRDMVGGAVSRHSGRQPRPVWRPNLGRGVTIDFIPCGKTPSLLSSIIQKAIDTFPDKLPTHRTLSTVYKGP